MQLISEYKGKLVWYERDADGVTNIIYLHNGKSDRVWTKQIPVLQGKLTFSTAKDGYLLQYNEHIYYLKFATYINKDTPPELRKLWLEYHTTSI